mgnify:CR=1 FL=1
MLSMLARSAPVVSEFGGAFLKIVGQTAKLGTGMGIGAGTVLAPIAAIDAAANSSPEEKPVETAKKATKAYVSTMAKTTAIGFYVGTAPISIPAKMAYDHLTENHTSQPKA